MDKRYKKIVLDIQFTSDYEKRIDTLFRTHEFAIGKLAMDSKTYVCEDRSANAFIIYHTADKTVESNIVSTNKDNEFQFAVLFYALDMYLNFHMYLQNISNMLDTIKNDLVSNGGVTPWAFFNINTKTTPDVEPLCISEVNSHDFVEDKTFSMKYFKTSERQISPDALGDKYKVNIGREYNEFEKERLENNKLVDGYVPTSEDVAFVKRIYNAITELHRAPSFFFYGPSGTGKSEKGKYFSSVLGLPYTFICCSAMTNEADFRGRPKALGNNGTLIEFGRRLVSSLCGKKIKTEDIASTKIEYTLTELILACRYGWIIEIQEPTLIVNAGTLGFLNCVLDNNRTLILPDGSQIAIHPNTVFIFTTNLDYEGCNPLNNSLLSRIDYVKKIDSPTLEEQVKRVAEVTKYQNIDNITKVVKCINELKIMMQDQDVTQGIADLRAAIDCINDCKVNGCSIRESARYTIEDKVCLEDGYAEDIKLKIDSILGEH